MNAYVYILRCRDGSFYTGYTTDLERRVRAHQTGRAAKYTRSRRPVELCYVEVCSDKPSAMRREWAIKQLSRMQKEELVCRSPHTFEASCAAETQARLGGGSGMPEEDKKDRVVAQFGPRAEAYVRSRSHADPEVLQQLMEQLEPAAKGIALDVATGGGHVAGALAPLVRHVVVSDMTPAMLATARTHLRNVDNLTYVVADAEHLPFLDASFETVTCRIAAHHFPHPEQFVQEAARVLRPGGRLLLVDNVVPADRALADAFNELELLRDDSHVRCASIEEWKAWLTGSGLSIHRESLRNKTLTFTPWMSRMARDDVHAATVETWLKDRDTSFQQCFGVQIEHGRVQSLTAMEWSVVCERR
ncbi:methyltransferase domain-containing protein [Alicyclobacillus sp. ALC3]|uniref:methyltransferase domain-containing protein n=1 Tax=Alicyclobacillus sp. ALC3 TaxID=2796143 RepID=UPI002378A87B|nr:methyltransferase domain-containing protein [Alicyclobacillus sp. ALC3]WDL97280.1 methyltransferase domain-containing protein [Alicyclobacillus sp. ALC3]